MYSDVRAWWINSGHIDQEMPDNFNEEEMVRFILNTDGMGDTWNEYGLYLYLSQLVGQLASTDEYFEDETLAAFQEYEGIVNKKREENGFLFLTTIAGDVILWPDEESSENDDGANAIARWEVDDLTETLLLESGEVDLTA